ncbi:uncharacterized protein LOC125235958 [Leguminivora glycinivorella]|uniref:uncharacterized protein LOC125235958 n=1 Tax=Leguminivora glycinivorella TaxID=1035111 RepID=UPI00201040CC|nr:uncharacterized protein LOC125235958 [Leguminivora glycinivorella]XP_047998577.1 uncharacterized protein LOC125235958 [Leguminivora glycinivorella]
MEQGDQNINKDMIDCDLIDVESLDFSDEQTWLYTTPEDANAALDIVDWQLSFDWPFTEDNDYLKTESELYLVLDHVLKSDVAVPNKHKFDSRTFVKPKKRAQRPSIQSIVESSPAQNKYLTYNKYSAPLGPLSPILRLKTFNVETDTDNSNAIKEYAKRRSLVSEEEAQLEDVDMTLVSEASERLSSDHLPSKPINIDLSQPAHNLHNTFNKGLTNIMNERGSLNMYQSGESLMRMSPPSLVSSLMMESSGNFNQESLDSRKSLTSHRDSGIAPAGRESIDPMMTSMTLSILDEKDMSTSFLSQTTYPDNDSLMDSLPPSLVSSVNSSYIVSNMSKARESTDSNNIFSSATFTHLEQSEKLLSARPRHQPFNHFQKRENDIRKSESYTKAKEEACQIDPSKVLMENGDKTTTKTPNKSEMSETVTLHYSNSKFRRDEKENLNSTFEKDDAFYKDMNMPRTVDLGKNSLNVTLDKQELNEIIQARQKLSLARKALPDDKLPNQADAIKTIQLPNQTITVPRHSMENASELLSRRRMNNSFDKEEPATRDTPKRNATFKKVSPRAASMDGTVVYAAKKDESELIDINLATTNLIESSERTTLEDWGSQQRAMVCSSESTDTGTFSSSSPPDSVPDTQHDPTHPSSISSTPLIGLRKPKDLLNIHTTISPIYDMVDDKSYTVTKTSPMERTYDKLNMKPSPNSSMDKTYDMNATVINSATMVKKSSAKRDILAGKVSPDKKMFGPSAPVKAQSMGSCASAMAPPVAVPRKTGLPTSKLRQYSSHKELSRIPAGNPVAARALPRSNMVRRGVYSSNPALSPTHPRHRSQLTPRRYDETPTRSRWTTKRNQQRSPSYRTNRR